MSQRGSCSPLAGVTATLFPLALLMLAFLFSIRHPVSAFSPRIKADASAWAAPALPAQDAIHVEFARRERIVWTRAAGRLALARTESERRWLTHQVDTARQGYSVCYAEVTSAARCRARLPLPASQ